MQATLPAPDGFTTPCQIGSFLIHFRLALAAPATFFHIQSKKPLECDDMKRLPLMMSFILFIALCVSVAYWAMQLLKPHARAVVASLQTSPPTAKLDAAAGLLGGRSSFAVASNFRLTGVVVAADPAESVAILIVNGKPARSIQTGKEIAPGVTLKEVYRDYVLLSERGVIKRVELPVKTMRR